MTFDGTQKLIGRGAQADVFLYQRFAYKVYKPSYPAEWIAFEKHQQGEINKAGLCPVRYYDTDDAHVIKMDFVDGEMLESKINSCVQENLAGKTDIAFGSLPEGAYQIIEGYKLLARAFKFVHSAEIKDLEIPHLRNTAAIGMDGEDSGKILPLIERLSGKMKECVCHLDMHFLNIMLPAAEPISEKSEYTIIDWMNARTAPPVFDYARSYVILGEFSADALEAYRQIVMPDVWASGVSDSDFADAVSVCEVIRKYEKK